MTVPAYTPYEQTVLRVATMEPCVGNSGSRDRARRLVHADLSRFGLTEEDLPAGRRAERQRELAPSGSGRAAGVTTQIFEWVRANPHASKADAKARFTECNPNTLSVQYGKARRTQDGA